MMLRTAGLRYSARYPSREQSIQLMVFLSESSGLMVFTKEPVGFVCDWHIQDGVLEIKGPRATNLPEVYVTNIGPFWEEAVEKYREHSVPVYKSLQGRSEAMAFVSTGSFSNNLDNLRQFQQARKSFGGQIGLWMTQYRHHRFDVGYPDYAPKDRDGYHRILNWSQENDSVVLPYVNGSLYDTTDRDFKASHGDWALRTQDGSLERYSARLKHLAVACPDGPWGEYIVNLLRGISATEDGQMKNGLYLDVLAATRPRVCWSESHGHVPGDPTAWVSGVTRILKGLAGISLMLEGNAEPYVAFADGFLMHEYTTRSNSVPLWSSVYGNVSNSYGWDMRRVETANQVERELARAESFGVCALGSPYLTHRIESNYHHVLTQQVDRALRSV
jgi:hypothetical protein